MFCRTVNWHEQKKKSVSVIDFVGDFVCQRVVNLKKKKTNQILWNNMKKKKHEYEQLSALHVHIQGVSLCIGQLL